MIINLLPEISCAKSAPAEKRKTKSSSIPGMGNPRYTIIPAETILAIRRMHEIEGKNYRQIHKQFPDLKDGYIRDVLEYKIRANLKVK